MGCHAGDVGPGPQGQVRGEGEGTQAGGSWGWDRDNQEFLLFSPFFWYILSQHVLLNSGNNVIPIIWSLSQPNKIFITRVACCLNFLDCQWPLNRHLNFKMQFSKQLHSPSDPFNSFNPGNLNLKVG